MRTLLRWILLLFPEDQDGIRRSEMEETFLDGYGAARAPVAYAARELWGLFRTGVAERMDLQRPRLPRQVGYELKFALRSLRRSRGFTAAAALTIALGVGATTLVFSFVDGILLEPLPYRDPAGLVVLSTFQGRATSVSEPEFMAFRTGARTLDAVAAAEGFARTLQVGGEARRVSTLAVTHELFPMLGVGPVLGRTFTQDEDVRDGAQVAVLSHALWLELSGGDPGVLDETITLDGRSYRVVGVMPRGFTFPSPETVLWTPYPIDAANLDRWNNHHLAAYARLRDGVDLSAAREEVRAMGERMVEEHGEFLEGLGFTADLEPLTEKLVGSTRTPLTALMVAVSLLLLIGCANVANLVLARGEGRRQEEALRVALGASRTRLVVRSLLESLSLAALGGALGVGVAVWGIDVIKAVAGSDVPRLQDVAVDLRVLAFAVAATVGTGLLFGLLPALSVSRTHLHRTLVEGGRSASSSRRARRTRRTLVAAEVALSAVLVVGAGVMLRSVSKLYGSDPGFRTEGVLTLRVSLPQDGPGAEADPADFFRRLVERAEGLPGVASVGAVERLPLYQPIGLSSIQIGGREVANIGDAPIAEAEQVTPGYFTTMDVRLREGRLLQGRDDGGGAPAVVVNEAFRRQILGGETAVGERVRFFSAGSPWMTVVGVVADERHEGLDRAVRPKMYFPHAQAGLVRRRAARTLTLVLHGQEVERLAGPLRTLVHEMNSGVPVDHVRTMASVKAASMTHRSYPTLLLSVFGLAALALASVGIYGLVAFDVNQRRHDIGVHVALGATGTQVLWMMVKDGLAPVAVGIVAGLVGAVGLTRLLASLLYGVSPVDVMVFAGGPAVLLLVAVSATLVPARRAAGLEPGTVLRSE